MKNNALFASGVLLSLAFIAASADTTPVAPVAPIASVVRPAPAPQLAPGTVHGTIIRGFTPVDLPKLFFCKHVKVTATSTEMTTCGRDERGCIPHPKWTRQGTATGIFGVPTGGKCDYSFSVPAASPFTVTASSEVVDGVQVVTPLQPVPPTLGVTPGESKLHNFPIRILLGN